jgi:glycosyltransferase involved in cell wall biosynthesis
MRICFMIDRLVPAGTESQLLALIRHLDRRRFQPYLCLLDGMDSTSRALEPNDCPVLRLGVDSWTRPRILTGAWRLIRFLRGERIEVLQTYFPDSTYLGVPAGRLAGVPTIVRTRNNLGHWLTPAHRRLGRVLNRLVTATVANCAAGRRSLLAEERPPPRSVFVLENGVDLARFQGAAMAGAPARAPRRVGAVANLRPIKGLEILVDAAAHVRTAYPRVEFVVAGEGEARPTLQRQIRDMGLEDAFTLVGAVADIPEFLARLDVAVLSSWSEGMSNALLEYMAAGRPLVATAVGAAVSLVDDGVHGLLVPAGDSRGLADAIVRLLREPKLAARLGAAARRRVEEQHSRKLMVQSFEDFYCRLAGGGCAS